MCGETWGFRKRAPWLLFTIGRFCRMPTTADEGLPNFHCGQHSSELMLNGLVQSSQLLSRDARTLAFHMYRRYPRGIPRNSSAHDVYECRTSNTRRARTSLWCSRRCGSCLLKNRPVKSSQVQMPMPFHRPGTYLRSQSLLASQKEKSNEVVSCSRMRPRHRDRKLERGRAEVTSHTERCRAATRIPSSMAAAPTMPLTNGSSVRD